MNKVHTPNKHLVSKCRYVVTKVWAVSLSSGMLLCLTSIALILLSLLYYAHLDKQAYHQWMVTGCKGNVDDVETCYFVAQMAAILLLLPLLISGCLLKWGAARSWKMVHAMQPISYADTGHLPAAGSLVRASQEPAQAQETVLLRAASAQHDERTEQLLRAVNEQH